MSRMSFSTISATVKRITEKAILVSWNDEDRWVPRSALSTPCDDEVKLTIPPDTLDLEIANWLIDKNGW